MPKKIHFSELSWEQVDRMCEEAVESCISYSDKIGTSGLSELYSHDIYTAIHRAIFREWEKAKEIKLHKKR